MPPWPAVYQQTQRWFAVGCFDAMADDLRALPRVVAERSFAWMARSRRLARDYECSSTTLAGIHDVAFACLMLQRAFVLCLGS